MASIIKTMKINRSGIQVAILILIIMLLTCHISNFVYPQKNYFNNIHNNVNTFENIFSQKKDIPLKYNVITYNKNNINTQCEAHAQIPCKVIQKQCISNPTQYKSLSDSEIAILYKEAYEMAGKEVLLRTLQPPAK